MNPGLEDKIEGLSEIKPHLVENKQNPSTPSTPLSP
jgi:hypothetical protein